MTCKALSIAALTVLWMSSMAALAHTQPNRKARFKLDIPFDFILGNRPMPAGTYTVQALLKSVPGADAIEVVAFRASGRIYQTTVTDSQSRQDHSPERSSCSTVTGISPSFQRFQTERRG
jgi:hypothetical protein